MKLNPVLLSVIIPARNEFPNVVHTVFSVLHCLEADGFNPQDFEIIVVNNCSDDYKNPKRGTGGTTDYIMPRGAFWNRIVRVLYDPIAGNHSARNKGAKIARGKYLFFSDAHMAYRPGFFKSILKTIDESNGLVHGCLQYLGAYPPVDSSGGYGYSLKLGEEIKGCVDEQTEILCKDGWKKYNEVSMDSEFATVNMQTHNVEFQKPSDLTIAHHSGHMVHLIGRSIDAFLTRNHRVICGKDEWKIKDADSIKPSDDYVPISTKGWAGIKNPQLTTDFVQLIGWIIAEGSYREDGSICIVQYNEKNREKIINLIRSLGFTFFVKKRGDIIININPGKLIKSFLPKKELTFDFLLQLSRIQLEKLFDVLIVADGWIGNKKNGARITNFYQVNTQTADAFQFLCVLLGKATRNKLKNPWKNRFGKKPIHHISVKKNTHTVGYKKGLCEYDGIVWCPTLPNGTIFIRRNGVVIPTGQTWNNYKLADTWFYVPAQGHWGLGCLKSQFMRFHGYPEVHRTYGGGEFYTDIKWWMFGSSVVVDPQAIGYHLAAGRGYSYHHDDYIHNVLNIAFSLGMDDWRERAYINWLRNGRKEVLDKIMEEGEKECAEDRAFVEKNREMTFNELIVSRPWDALNDIRHGKHNSAMTIFHDTWLELLKNSSEDSQEAYKNSKYQQGLDKFIRENLSAFVYRR